jgi:hypothetical protein
VSWLHISLWPCGGTSILTLNRASGSFITTLQMNVGSQIYNSVDLHWDIVNSWRVFDGRYYPREK